MLLNIKTGRGVTPVPMQEIMILVASLHTIAEHGIPFVYTDRHAYMVNARFSSNASDLASRIDWTILQNSDFKYDAQDMGKMDRYQAEALIHRRLPFELIAGVIVYDDAQMARIESSIQAAGYSNPVRVDGRFFF